MNIARTTTLAIELVALAAAIATAWWLGSVATDAWLGRVSELGVAAPEAATVRAAARSACMQLSAGLGALIVARVVTARRIGPATVAVPWLLPALAVALLLGHAFHLATVEVVRGTALAPTAAGYAQGVLIGCIAGAAILVAPVASLGRSTASAVRRSIASPGFAGTRSTAPAIDLVELASRARTAIAVAIGAIFVALAVAGSGPAGSGTRINLGPLQPIEVVKPLAVLFLAAYLGARATKLRWQRRRVLGLRWPRLELLVPALGALVAIVAGLYVVGDLGPVLLLACVFLGMFFIASRATGWVVLALALVAALVLVLALWPHVAGGGTVQTRLVMWQAPWTNGLPNGYQLAEGLWAISAGGWDGQGLAGAAVPLPPAGKTDLALAVLAEQLGARALVVYHVALAAIVVGALHVAANSRTAERVLVAGGIGILVLAQWLVIEAGTLGYLPLTGIVVPFISLGRTSTIVFVALVAFVVQLSLDARPRASSPELVELHAASRGVLAFAIAGCAVALVASLGAALVGRTETLSRGIVMTLADRTRIHRQNPRLVVLAARLRRGSILDRHGDPLAISTDEGRRYPLGNALGTLLGVSPSPVLLPPWALERRHDHLLRGYAERARSPGGLAWPDLRSFVPLLDLPRAARGAALAARDADLASRSVRLTLDARLQAEAARLAAAVTTSKAGKLAAAAVVIDVDSGHVLARVQVPDYDPAQPARLAPTPDDPARQRRFVGTYGAWPDKTGVQGMFQSGSVGKLFTALAAVRAGHGDARFECRETDAQGPLFTRKGWPKPIHDHASDRPHGTPDLVSAIAVSCNVYFGQLGLALGPEPFQALLGEGLEAGYSSAATTFDPGAAGSRQLASTAFGQGAMVMSVMQAARMTAAIAAGGVYTKCPATMELDAACEVRHLVDDPQLVAPIVAGMRRVVTAGTASRLVSPPGVRVYGKTGTADVRGFAGEEPFGIARGAPASPHSWFVAFAEPTSAPELAVDARGRLAIAVVVPRGGTGASAAGPLAMQILAAARELGYLQ